MFCRIHSKNFVESRNHRFRCWVVSMPIPCQAIAQYRGIATQPEGNLILGVSSHEILSDSADKQVGDSPNVADSLGECVPRRLVREKIEDLPGL